MIASDLSLEASSDPLKYSNTTKYQIDQIEKELEAIQTRVYQHKQEPRQIIPQSPGFVGSNPSTSPFGKSTLKTPSRYWNFLMIN